MLTLLLILLVDAVTVLAAVACILSSTTTQLLTGPESIVISGNPCVHLEVQTNHVILHDEDVLQATNMGGWILDLDLMKVDSKGTRLKLCARSAHV